MFFYISLICIGLVNTHESNFKQKNSPIVFPCSTNINEKSYSG